MSKLRKTQAKAHNVYLGNPVIFMQGQKISSPHGEFNTRITVEQVYFLPLLMPMYYFAETYINPFTDFGFNTKTQKFDYT
ncbi:MAG: hypothetical protein ACPGVO_03765 [Spirulinaceae cyanobacterium]